jgi:hypothetical protein
MFSPRAFKSSDIQNELFIAFSFRMFFIGISIILCEKVDA